MNSYKSFPKHKYVQKAKLLKTWLWPVFSLVVVGGVGGWGGGGSGEGGLTLKAAFKIVQSNILK